MSLPSAFSSNDRLILSSWFNGVDCDDTCDRPDVEKALDDRGYTEPVGFLYTRHQAAVAGVVLDCYQHRLLHWREARQIVSEAIQRRRKAGRVVGPDAVAIRHLLTITWGAGLASSWSNLYALIWLPEFGRYVVTDSTDDSEPYDHTDFAIGSFGPCADPNAAAMDVIGAHWRLRRDSYMDDAPEVLELQLGTIVAGVPERWLATAWAPAEEDEVEEEGADADDSDAAEDSP
jgi:hypothetical protein